MKTLGLIGGTSWVSTIDYYRCLSQLANEKRGGLNFAQIPMLIKPEDCTIPSFDTTFLHAKAAVEFALSN